MTLMFVICVLCSALNVPVEATAALSARRQNFWQTVLALTNAQSANTGIYLAGSAGSAIPLNA